jgi:hypothetical protein
MPRGGRPLVIANSILASRNAAIALRARSVSTFSLVTSVPSTSARTSFNCKVGNLEQKTALSKCDALKAQRSVLERLNGSSETQRYNSALHAVLRDVA